MSSDMPIWTGFLTPILEVMDEGTIYARGDIYELAANRVGLTAEQKTEMLGSGGARYKNRIGWAINYLRKISALTRPSRGNYAATPGGKLLIQKLPNIRTEVQVEKFLAEVGVLGLTPSTDRSSESSTSPSESAPETEVIELDPIEQVQTGVERIHTDVADDLLFRLHQNEPSFFEQTVVDLVVAMGYAGADGVAARTQLTNDGGIDGVIDQDALGLNRVYIQAKRYALDSTVSRPDIQGFVGALHGVQADRGLFITTAKYSNGAKAYAESVNTRVILIDGPRLANLMIRYDVGVQIQQTINIVKLDEDYFE